MKPEKKSTESEEAINSLLGQFVVKPTTLGMIGVGGCGGNGLQRLLTSINPKDNEHFNATFADTDGGNLRKRIIAASKDREQNMENSLFYDWLALKQQQCRFIQLGPEATEGKGAGGDPKLGAKAAEEEATVEQLNAALDASNINLVITGLGGGSGSGAAPVIAKMSVELGKTTVVIAVMPFANEGKRTLFAQEAEKELLSIAPTIFIYNENLYDLENIDAGSLSHEAAFQIVNNHTIDPQLAMFRRLLKEIGKINVDDRDFEELTKLGPHLYFGYSELPTNNGDSSTPEDSEMVMKQVFEELISNPFQDSNLAKLADGYILLLSGSWTIGEERDLKNQLSSYFSSSGKKNIDDIRTWSGIFDDADQRIAVLLTAAAEKVPTAIPYQVLEIAPKSEVDETHFNPEGAEIIQKRIAAIKEDAPIIMPATEPPVMEVQVQEDVVELYYDVKEGRSREVLYVSPQTKKDFDRLSQMNIYGKPLEEQQKIIDEAEEIIARVREESGEREVRFPRHLLPTSSSSLRIPAFATNGN